MSSLGITVQLPDGTPHTIYEPHPKQVLFHQSEVPNLLAVGSRGSGKSRMLLSDIYMRALSIPGCNIVLVRKTWDDHEKSHVLWLEPEMKLLGGYYHSTKHIAFFPNGSKLFLTYVGGTTDGLNLLSAEFIAAYFDELSVIPWEFFTKLTASVRIAGRFKDMGLKSIIRGATNPLGVSAGMLNQYFVTQDVDPEDNPDYNPLDWGHIRIDMQDNPSVDVEDYKKRYAGYPEHVRRAWLEGEYTDEAALFDFHPKRDGKPYHVIEELDIPSLLKASRIYRVYDHGYNKDPAYCAWIAHLGHRYIVFHEMSWLQTMVPSIAAEIKRIDKRLGIDGEKVRIIDTFCDPSIGFKTGVRTVLDEFELNGIPMTPSVNDREIYASMMHTALATEAEPGVPKLQIYCKGRNVGCPYLTKSIPQQRFNAKRPLAMADQAHDHAVVAVAYFLISNDSHDVRPLVETKPRPWLQYNPPAPKLGTAQVSHIRKTFLR